MRALRDGADPVERVQWQIRDAEAQAAALAGAAYAGNLGDLDDTLVLHYLIGEGEDRKRAAQAVDSCCSDDQAKLLNLYHAVPNHEPIQHFPTFPFDL